MNSFRNWDNNFKLSYFIKSVAQIKSITIKKLYYLGKCLRKIFRFNRMMQCHIHYKRVRWHKGHLYRYGIFATIFYDYVQRIFNPLLRLKMPAINRFLCLIDYLWFAHIRISYGLIDELQSNFELTMFFGTQSAMFYAPCPTPQTPPTPAPSPQLAFFAP